MPLRNNGWPWKGPCMRPMRGWQPRSARSSRPAIGASRKRRGHRQPRIRQSADGAGIRPRAWLGRKPNLLAAEHLLSARLPISARLGAWRKDAGRIGESAGRQLGTLPRWVSSPSANGGWGAVRMPRRLAARRWRFGRARRLFSRSRSTGPSAPFISTSGQIALDQRRWERAQTCFQKVRRIAIQLGSRLLEAVSYQHLARTAAGQRDWRRARRHSRKAMDLYASLGNRFAQANVCAEWARWATGCGRLKEAREISPPGAGLLRRVWRQAPRGRAPLRLGHGGPSPGAVGTRSRGTIERR